MAYNRKKRAQASFEFIAIFSIAIIVLIPMIYLFQRYTMQSSDAIQTNKIRAIGEDIANTAETVYYMGYPARLTIQEEFPNLITNMSITSDRAKGVNIISFNITGGRELAYFCGVNINASITPNDYSAGLKTIIFETRNSSQGNYVWIEFR